MHTHPRPATNRPPLSFLLLLALLLPLLAACGGSAAGTAEPVFSNINSGLAPGGGGTSLPPAEPTRASVAGAPTAAPAAAPAAGDAIVKSSESAAGGAPAIAPPAIGIATPVVPPERINNQQQGTPLKAGEVDDNADFATYLDYLRSYGGPPAHEVDVSERYILTVVNDRQQPVLDARVRLFDGQQQVFEGRTYAGGKTIFFPRTLKLSGNVTSLRVQVDKGNSAVEGTLSRGQDGAQTFVLRGAEALPQTPRLDVLFLLDSTGSMGDEIGQIQNTIASIADRIDRIEPRPELRFGLVAYRDRGDEYVTRVYDFTPDVGTFQQLLASVRADGGGDTPESLNEGLHEAIQGVHWADDAVRLSFLVADAPPHLDYDQDYDYLQEARRAVAEGVKVYTIGASNSDDEAEYVFRQLAQQTLAHFIFLTYQPGQNAGTPGDTTTHHVDPAAFTVERLDDLVVQVVRRELAQAQGAS
ncbi:MAG TPA: vWA domain-containing protein [Roseiflexaceae bacterium]